MSYREDNYENAVIELFENELNYDYKYGPEVERDYREPLFLEQLEPALIKLNPKLPKEAIEAAIKKLTNFDRDSVIKQNQRFTDYLQNGMEVSYFDTTKSKSITTIVYLIDYINSDNNTFLVSNQWTVSEFSVKRPDVIVFVNGLPLVIFELKTPSREDADVTDAYLQLRNYQKEIPNLFKYNAFCVISDLSTTKAGTLTANEDRFMEWKTIDGSYENTQYANFDTFIQGIFEKRRFLDILKNFICFSEENKILAAYHQYFAVNKAINSTIQAEETDGRGGVFWHTQGSGKSLSMVFYSHLIQQKLPQSTIVVLTDRNDLDNQLYLQFAKCEQFLRQKPIQATSRDDLYELLNHREANGIIFTTMQKFEESDLPLSTRRNIIVMADEAHRSQYGLTEKVDTKTGKVKLGTARVIRNSLPNATYIGFTGTPISNQDKSTTAVFGNYIDVYDMTQAVEDGATRPVYYESRVIGLKLNDHILGEIDKKYQVIAEQAEDYVIQKSKKELSKLDAILGANQTIDALVEDIINHYEQNRQQELTGKAMIVAYSRPIAIKIYHKILEKRPKWNEKIGVVMTSANNDPEEWHDIVGNKQHKNELAKRFKDDNDEFKIAIVVDMWLTGFDVPSLSTMYIFKPMSGHNLMQAIARVNRVYKDKEGGLIVDYVGIAGALKQAMNDYTSRDKDNYGDTDIENTALPKFDEKLEVCRDILHGFDYAEFLYPETTDLKRAKLISGGLNFLMSVDKEKQKQNYIEQSLLLRQALSLCRSRVDYQKRLEAAYFEAIRTLLTRVTSKTKKMSLKEINEQINSLLESSIRSDGVINLFSDIDTEFSLFDPDFLDEVSHMEEKNLAVELLKKLIAEQVSVYKRTNRVKADKFSELLKKSMHAYLNGLLTNEEVIAELMRLAHDLSEAHLDGERLGLTDEELAFYDALTKPEAIRDFYENNQLIALTRTLTDELRKSQTIDWQRKNSARAGMRRKVKRLLKKYHYPPEQIKDAVKTVIQQCEMWADNQ